jgi:hypothetical protein
MVVPAVLERAREQARVLEVVERDRAVALKAEVDLRECARQRGDQSRRGGLGERG